MQIEAPFVALGAAEHKRMLGMLPQAHTCDNLLELPNYWEALLQVGLAPVQRPFPLIEAECAQGVL